MPPSVGMRIGRYELLARLGSGGMGEVFRARDHDLQRDVAIKFLPERFATDAVRLGRFAQEARAASQLNHPNIVTIHEIGQAAGLPYIVMELVQGHTLRALMTGRPLPVRRTLEVASQLANGLAKAHAAGIVHRDLKPENVMVTEDGYVKILDFGLAKLLTSESGDREIWFDSDHPTWPEASPPPRTTAGAVLGTVGYMSPEQARGRPVDFRADQFAFGAIVFEMATGQQAFRRETAAQTITAIIEDPSPPLAGLSPAFPMPARWIVERCLEKDPAGRYASTLDLARELQHVSEHLGEVGGPGSTPGPSSPGGPGPSRARRWLVIGAASAVVAVLGLVSLQPVRETLAVALELRAVPREKQVAVLPFRTAADTPEDRALASGLAGMLATRLSELERFHSELAVTPATEVRQAGVRTAEAAWRALGASLSVEGSVQRVGERLTFTATLVDGRERRTLRVVSAPSFEELLVAVVRLLEGELSLEVESSLRAAGTGVAEASVLHAQAVGYAPYVLGRSALERYEQRGNLERALELFQKALERDPRYALAHAGLGETYWRLSRITHSREHVSLAERHCDRAIELDDLLASAWVSRGIVRAGSGRAEEALADFQRALDRNPRSADAHRERADALERLGRPDEAEAAYARAIALRPESWANHNHLGAFLAAQGRYDEAERSFEAALALAPDNARVWSNLGAARIRQGRLGEAEAALAKSIELDPTASALSNLGVIQSSQGRWADAAGTFERATAVSPHDYRVWRNLGAARYWAPGERERAGEAYRQAAALAEEERRLDPRNPRVLAELADCRAMLGDETTARALAGEAARLAGADATVTRIVADTYEQLGDRAAALRWLGAALQGGYPRDDIERDPWLERLRTDPRYERLVDDRPSTRRTTR